MDLFITIDLGSSAIKVLYTTEEGQLPKYLILEPEVLAVPKQSLERFRDAGSDYSFVGIGDKYYAVGKLARECFSASSNLSMLKSEYAVPRILAAIWAAIGRQDLGRSKIKIVMRCLLPFGEMRDQLEIESKLASAIADFDTPSGNLRGKLVAFRCHPEGGGIASYFVKNNSHIHSKKLGVIMMGHRNVSAYQLVNGCSEKYRTSDLGFIRAIDTILKSTSGYSDRALTEYVGKYLTSDRSLDRLDASLLQPLLLRRDDADRQAELKKLLAAIGEAKMLYWLSVENWLQAHLGNVDEIVVGGGTCWVFGSEFMTYRKQWLGINDGGITFKYMNANVEWGSNRIVPKALEERFADCYCLWLGDMVPAIGRYLERKQTQVVVG